MNPQLSIADTFLHPGEFHFGNAPGTIRTLLGSCVAVTVWYAAYRMGGMCHILLPSQPRPAHGVPLDERFADHAIKRFALEVRAIGIYPSSCHVQLFGGGDMFAGTAASELSVGVRNIESTRAALIAHGFLLPREHVGGQESRRLTFDLSTGRVHLSLSDGRALSYEPLSHFHEQNQSDDR